MSSGLNIWKMVGYVANPIGGSGSEGLNPALSSIVRCIYVYILQYQGPNPRLLEWQERTVSSPVSFGIFRSLFYELLGILM